MRRSINSPSFGSIELKDWKLKKNSLWCIALWIFTGVKELSNTWLVDGDRNTKFFHQVANRRRKFNVIHKIKVDDELFVDAAVKNAIVNFYENLYHEDQPSRPFLGGIAFNSISLDVDDTWDMKKDLIEDDV